MHAVPAVESHAKASGAAVAATALAQASDALLRGCFELFRSMTLEIARLSIETTNDLFELDPLVTKGEIETFKARRGEWLQGFDGALCEFFERRLAGQRRKSRRPDVEESFRSLRLLDDADTSKQSALGDATKRLAAAARHELDALDYRVSVLFDGPPSRGIDNPFSPAYLLDAIGRTSRSLYAEPRIWRPLMERVIGDFAPAINQTYVRLNRFLAERGVLPEIGAALRARSELRPADDRQLLPLFRRLLNDVHPSMQAWHTLDSGLPGVAGLAVPTTPGNPYLAAMQDLSQRPTMGTGGNPWRGAVVASPALSPVLGALDHWQRSDPLADCLRSAASDRSGASVSTVNRIPLIRDAIASRIADESGLTVVEVVAFLFDYILRDPSIPRGFQKVFDGLQVPILKVALADPGFFVDETHPARRLLDALAEAAIGADDGADYGKALAGLALSIVATINAEFVLDDDAFERGCRTLDKFIDAWTKQVFLALQPHIGAGLAAEASDAERMPVRMLVRDKLAGLDVPVDVRAFLGTVWTDYLARLQATDGADADPYVTAVKTIDELLWSIVAKERTSQKARLAKMIPPLVRSLRTGGAAVQVADDKLNRFLDTLYALHVAAIRPGAAGAAGSSEAAGPATHVSTTQQSIGNPYDFVTEAVLGTWFALDRDGARVTARLSWISPMRVTYLFVTRSASEVLTFTPEALAWEMSAGKAELIREPVPLFDRAISATLEFLAAQKVKGSARTAPAAGERPSAQAGESMAATVA